MKPLAWITALLITAPLIGQTGQKASTYIPATYQVDSVYLLQLKTDQKSAVVKTAIAEADAALGQGPFTVTRKSQSPSSGDKHDYMSLAPYFWPNPSTPNHLPYVRHDGEHNPDVGSIPDHNDFTRICDTVHALGLGYELTGREEYAARATLLIRTWFLNPDTKMNPNLKFAQAILGTNDGRGTGILEARGLPDVADAVAMVRSSNSWTPADETGIKSWFGEYYKWLTISKNGIDESNAKNNHGTWYDFQAVGIALFLGDREGARARVVEACTKRIGIQIESDGRQPLELERTKSYHYSVFNLEALMRLAVLGDRVGVDLWDCRSPQGGSIRTALDYLIPFAEKPDSWKYKEISDINGKILEVPLLFAASHYRSPQYATVSHLFKGRDTAEVLILRSEARDITP